MRNAPLLASVPASPDAFAPDLAGVAVRIAARAADVDAAAAFPADDIADLAASGLLAAPLPYDHGGMALGLDAAGRAPALAALTTIGAASLTVGRLFEGHVNAVRLAAHHGGSTAMSKLADEVASGRISGVWNAERGAGPTATRIAGGYVLDGAKIHCSGAGAIRRPVVTARVDGEPLMLLPDMAASEVTVDLSVWRAAGMRGTATGGVVFDGLFVPDAAVIGGPGDYYRSPHFSGGAWRVIAVQLGALGAIVALHAERLAAGGRGDDPVVRARFFAAAAAYESARLLVEEASRRAEGGGAADAIDAYVDLARGRFEAEALTVIEATRRNIGLSTYIAPDALDRMLRDMETYLRQPFLDASRDHAARWLIARGGVFAA